VDRNGNLSALLYGKLGNVFKPIELDSLSNLKINISSQDLLRIIQAPSYGGAKYIDTLQTVSPGSTKKIASITGQGIIYGGKMWLSGGDAPEYVSAGVDIDGGTLSYFSMKSLNDFRIDSEGSHYLYLDYYDATSKVYVVKFTRMITFDSYVDIYVSVSSSSSAGVSAQLYFIYALR